MVSPLLGFVRGVRHVAVDRVFVFFDAGLKARMPRASEFAGAPGHPAPGNLPDLPAHPDSWKHTRFAEGNVQLSFSRDAMPLPGGDPASMVHSADVDIDLGRGLAHAQGVARQQRVQAGPQDEPVARLHALYAQGILPRYTLDPAPSTTLRAMPILRSVSAPPPVSRSRRSRTSRAARVKVRATRARKKKSR